MTEGRFARRALADLDLSTEMLDAVKKSARPVALRSNLPVAELAWDSVAVASAALDRVGTANAGLVGGAAPPIILDATRIATAYTSERHLRVNDQPIQAWAPLSGFWSTRDGFVRVHANYAHHEQRLRTLLDLPTDAPRSVVERVMSRWSASELEDAAARAGALVYAVRTSEQWAAHDQSRVGVQEPWIEVNRTGETRPRPPRRTAHRAQPLAGLRVLDMTRVIAGPVAGRTLALAGADVLRVDSPDLPEPLWQHLDTGHGKASTFLDLKQRRDQQLLSDLAAEADLMLLGYAPTALERLGLDRESAARRFPGLTTGYVRAWSRGGPWADRRGFDSLVQAASGIAMRESSDARTPGALPAQALDHSTGYLLAASVATLWLRGRVEGGSWSTSMSLQRCAEVLLDVADEPALAQSVPEPWGIDEGAQPTTVEFDTAAGHVVTAASAVSLGGEPAEFRSAAGPLGWDIASW